MKHIDSFQTQPNLPQLEEEVLKHWDETDAFAKSVSQRPATKPYIFYDGPPFATGLPHYGHLLASTIKDVIPRYWTMKGYRVERVWGWDCHGVPIENMIEKELDLKGGKKGIDSTKIGKSSLNALAGGWTSNTPTRQWITHTWNRCGGHFRSSTLVDWCTKGTKSFCTARDAPHRCRTLRL